MTNDYRAGKLAIQKCDKCRDGYLIVKAGKYDGFFLVCTNYKTNGTGCSKMVPKKAYYELMGYKMEPEEVVVTSQEKKLYVPAKSVSKPAIADEKSNSNINIVPTEDYVEVVRAQLKPIEYSNWELGQVFYTVICGLQNMSSVRFYGVTMLVDILRGADSKRIFDNNLNKIQEFGALKEMPRETIQSIIEWMIKEHYILKTKGKYPVLHSTYEGLHYS